MNKNLFQNDNITGNSLLGFEFRGQFKYDENVMVEKLKDVLNRDVTFSNIDYKLLEPSDTHAVVVKDGNFYEIKTPMYSYFEALFLLPKILDFLKGMSDYKNSYMYFKIGFNESYVQLSQINVMKFILEFNEDFVLKHLSDITKDGDIEKLTNIKPESLESCMDSIERQIDGLKFNDDLDDVYGINFSTIKLGYITFKYAREINYRNKWEDLLKCVNHTIITLYNTCSVTNFNDGEINKLKSMNDEYKEILNSFGCYELFRTKYPKIKLTSDLNNDNAVIEIIFPSIKDKLFDLVIRNGIKEANINYDSDVSRLQVKDLELRKCYHISGVDIVNSELTNCSVKDCDIYDTKIEKSTIVKCNLFGYANCKDSKFRDCFISRNISLKDCHVSGTLGKIGGTMKGGSLKNTTIITSLAEIGDDVEKNNVNEVQ